ncbi:MAG: heme-binding domain-containing protein [Bacteroidales bacterium]|nr:heme-binding domain-containing protein [Lentimicrobiaceae bacterium]MDD5694196.1 heme-binding domain-containing protein [Bacteroidales bacterium]
MKRTLLLGIAAIGLLVAYVTLTSPAGSAESVNSSNTVWPENVAKILENSCYDCHTDLSGNAMAKAKLNFDGWDKLTDAKKLGTLDEICSEVTRGSMPPAKYISKYADRKLSPEQVTLICSWVEEESGKR